MGNGNPPLLPHATDIIDKVVRISLIVNFDYFTVDSGCIATDDLAGSVGCGIAHPVRHRPCAGVELLDTILQGLAHGPYLVQIEQFFSGAWSGFDHYRIFAGGAEEVGGAPIIIGDRRIPRRIIPYEILLGHQCTWLMLRFIGPDAVGIAIVVTVFRFDFITVLTGCSSHGNGITSDVITGIIDIGKQACDRVEAWAGCCGVSGGEATVITDDDTYDVVSSSILLIKRQIKQMPDRVLMTCCSKLHHMDGICIGISSAYTIHGLVCVVPVGCHRS
ncbi:hypothetical protein D3C75_719930 [compost metagenome]